MKLSEIAAKIGAQLDGSDLEIDSVAGIGEARAGQLTFIANPKYASQAKSTQASAVIVDDGFPALNKSTLRTKNPYLAFAQGRKRHCAGAPALARYPLLALDTADLTDR